MAGERWATFDCYGTLIDWEAGIADALASIWPEKDRRRLLARYHDLEPVVEAGRSIPYRRVMTEVVVRLAREDGLSLSKERETAVADSLPSWAPFPEVPGAVSTLHDREWRIAVLSNTDPDLLAASIERIGAPVDLRITAADAGSYKPAFGHWRRFREVTGVEPWNHVHVGASLYHDIAPCAELGIPAVWINRLRELGDVPCAGELPDLSRLPATLDRLHSTTMASLRPG